MPDPTSSPDRQGPNGTPHASDGDGATVPGGSPAAPGAGLGSTLPTAGELEDRVAIALRQLFRGVDMHSRRLSELCGLTGPQLAVLRTVARHEPTPMGAVARAIHLSHATVSGIVDRLAVRGLVTRTRSDDDRRSVLLAVTDSGRALLRGAPPILPESMRTKFAAIADWDRLHLLAALERIGAMIDESGPPHSP